MSLVVTAACHVGVVRRLNEDMVLVGDQLLRDASVQIEIETGSECRPFVLAVADGMGGHKGGARASEMVQTHLRAAIGRLSVGCSTQEVKGFVAETLATINQMLLREGEENREEMGMGSTLTAVVFYGTAVFLLNLGDSRVYRFRDGVLARLTRDHSLAGLLGDDEVPKNIILRSLGALKPCGFDFEEISNRLGNGDALVLCSDGITVELSDDEIERELSRQCHADGVLAAALAKGGRDNISVVVAQLVECGTKE